MHSYFTKDNSEDNWKERTTFIINRLFINRLFINRLLVLFGVIYLICIPFKWIGEKNRFKSIDMGFAMVLLIANSDLVKRITHIYFGKDGVELSIKELKEQVQEQVQEQIKQKDDLNAEVLKSLDIYLSETIAQQPDSDQLQQQIDNVSPDIAEYIYFRAKEARHQAWRTNKKRIAERTIPIFKALINSRYGKNRHSRHRFYAQLGYALKDQEYPQWKEARKNLEQAIDLWKKENNSESLPPYYCFNWLICMSEIAKQEKEKYDPEMENTIRERLHAIRECSPLLNAWNNSKDKDCPKIRDCQNWLSSNFPNIQKEEMENEALSNESCHREAYSDS